MNLHDIEVFHAVMISGGAGRASELLGTSQPTVSRTIANLERSIGFSLFDRVRGRLIPTRDGRLFHEEVQRNLIGLDRLQAAAARIREVGEGSLRIASLAALGQVLIPRAVTRFLQHFSDARISLQIRTSSVVKDLVASGQVDLGLAADEIDVSGVQTTVFATPRAVCVFSRDHPLAGRDVITPADFARYPLLALSPEDTVRKAMDRALAAANVEPKIVVETPFSSTVVTLAGEGAGIGIANPLAIDHASFSRVSTAPFEPAIYFRALLLRPPDAPRSRLVEAFLSALYETRNASARG
ncbi:LysR substrate-binding domain-containing protein [Microvirga splendida]|uniref:LysR family transcriptional regulator n=1 Tax=Microvirga splendida TaxID=2795727 RepID=A0ABS0Y3T9_9HYPH|nr:LysR substrate-binding domain-containing protein [Microvirga splendida]MBJ6126934.1 LysR family transcriptional regulator [Microvirga splendida]